MTNRIPVANPDNLSWAKGAFLFSFGAYGDTKVIVLENTLDDALETAGEWLAENAPGIFIEPDYESSAQELYGKPVDECDPDEQEKIWEHAETDLTYTESGHIASWEWGVQDLDFTKVKALLTSIDMEDMS